MGSFLGVLLCVSESCVIHVNAARFGWLVGNEEWKAAEASETWWLENLLMVKDVGICRPHPLIILSSSNPSGHFWTQRSTHVRTPSVDPSNADVVSAPEALEPEIPRFGRDVAVWHTKCTKCLIRDRQVQRFQSNLADLRWDFWGFPSFTRCLGLWWPLFVLPLHLTTRYENSRMPHPGKSASARMQTGRKQIEGCTLRAMPRPKGVTPFALGIPWLISIRFN